VEPLADYDPGQVGDFRLRARIGAGGMGRVFLGYSPGGRPVAVKVVHPDLARDPEFMRRFRREVAAAQAVSDAYTAAVVGAGPDDDPPWLATTYVAGPSLADLVTRSGPLPEDAIWRLAGGLAEALQAIHAEGLIHRDLKPGNILIAADGPRVIDFGISRATDGTVVTATRMTIGTPAYMSPEQAEGGSIGPTSDIFSLGSVLAFSATGTSPFGGGEMFAIAYRVVHAEPELGGVPASLRPLIAACLAKDPAARPALGELLRDVGTGSAAYPAVMAGRFWPDTVATLLESSTFTPALPPPPTPLPASPGSDTAPGVPGILPPASGQRPGVATDVVPGSQYSPTTAAPVSAAAPVAQRRRRPGWVLPVVLGAVVAAGAGLAIALASSPSPTPPKFLSPTSSSASASSTATASASSQSTGTPGTGTGAPGAGRSSAPASSTATASTGASHTSSPSTGASATSTPTTGTPTTSASATSTPTASASATSTPTTAASAASTPTASASAASTS
jgi:serine/threonine protein kinase